MSRIDGVSKERAGWFYRFARLVSKRTLGSETEPLRIMGHHQGVLAATGTYNLISERAKRVGGDLKSLATVKAAMLVGCHF